jgi:hypothetical protein
LFQLLQPTGGVCANPLLRGAGCAAGKAVANASEIIASIQTRPFLRHCCS